MHGLPQRVTWRCSPHPSRHILAQQLTSDPTMPERRFPTWSVEEQEACLVVHDRDGQQLAYVYFENESGRRSAAKLLEGDEARRIPVNIAKQPELLSRHRMWGVR
jgi:hypothetical protein